MVIDLECVVLIETSLRRQSRVSISYGSCPHTETSGHLYTNDEMRNILTERVDSLLSCRVFQQPSIDQELN